MGTHSSPLAWRIPVTEEPEGYRPEHLRESDTTELMLKCMLRTEHPVSILGQSRTDNWASLENVHAWSCTHTPPPQRLMTNNAEPRLPREH